jgi:alkanesulfonate monooxygenase SsuD/methylene tetrahydromethanopterin reductase-like flavin-dependent oxidoreductase (luciferase family)
MKIGVLLPTFRYGANDALEFAERAARLGLDGLFAYDHLWPMGEPTRPSLAPFPLLALVARRHERVVVAPLVARVALVGTDHLVEEYRTLEAIAPGRVIATLGAGDKLSAAENEAYGLARQSADERRGLMAETATALRDTMPVWFGGGAAATNELARELGAVVNLWDGEASRVAELARTGEVSWAGPVPDDLFSTLDAVRDAGASWAVLSPQVDLDLLAGWRRDN